MLLARESDHPTELMTLRGTRIAVIEETPEGHRLPTKRLKDLTGGKMTARLMRQNYVTWDSTHTLFVNSNYTPQISETDTGTWRRLALVKFPYRFVHPNDPLMAPNERKGDPGLRDRLKLNDDGQLEAVLAWLALGAKSWFDMDKRQLDTPLTVRVDTEDWRAESDLIVAYARERLTFDPASAVPSKDLYEDLTEWLKASGRQVWNDQTFSSRFAGHTLAEQNHIEKKRVNVPVGVSMRYAIMPPPVGKTTLWLGVKFN